MKKRVLLTSLGGTSAYEFIESFNKNSKVELFLCDSNENAMAKSIFKNFFTVLHGEDPNYSIDLVKKMKDNNIEMVIPGSDEEAFSLMNNIELFEKENIIVAVQKKENFFHLNSKTSMYNYLKEKGIKLPKYESINNKEELVKFCNNFDLSNNLLLIKPVQERGGRHIYVLSNKKTELKENILNVTLDEFIEKYYDKTREYVLMEYIDGTVYDIDVLKYKNGDVYFGSRRRYTNITKDFKGNIFDFRKFILDYSKKIYDAFPTDFLIDYDLMITKENEIYLLEVNPRPSGSTISYLPFDVNLYEVLIMSHLFNENIEIKDLNNKKTLLFNKVLEA